MNYSVINDIKVACALLSLSLSELANELGVARSTVIRIVNGKTTPSELFLESFYGYIYSNKIKNVRINNLKVQFAIDKYDKVLFHGTKNIIESEIDLKHSRGDIDIGTGFYLGESYEQAASYIYSNKKSSVYLFDCNELKNLKTKEYSVNLEWMLIVCYYRGQIDEYKNSHIIKKLIDEINQYDVIIAPIADNDMYETMSQFSRGDITDLQAISALSASNLGKQHVLKTEEACKAIKIVDRLYLCQEERDGIKEIRKKNAEIASDKSKISIMSLRRQGKYIEELLK